MITLDDIAAGVLARLGATFEESVPGKAWFKRADENAAVPYAVFTVDRAGPAEWRSDGSYLQPWTLRVGVYTAQGATVPQAAQAAMAAALNPDPTAWPDLRDGKVFECLPEGFDGEFSPVLRDARDVFVSAGQWGLIVAGNLAP